MKLRLKEARLARGLTQRQLADALGVVQSCIANWESGFSKPDIYSLKKIALILETSTDELIRRD